jgi:phosphate starvation-inducible protein PhoH
MAFTCDIQQAVRPSQNGLLDFIGLYNSATTRKGVDLVEFAQKDIERHDAVKEILRIYGDNC